MHRMPRFLFRPMTAIMIVILNSASLDSQNLVYFASRRSVYVSAYREIRHYLEKSIHFFFFFYLFLLLEETRVAVVRSIKKLTGPTMATAPSHNN